jgi:sensor c-di-GMP phosphodiesterase-like protein
MITRLALLSASIALGCLATIVPVLTSLYVAEEEAQRRDRQDLHDFAGKALLRAELVTDQSAAALADLERSSSPPCSPDDLAGAARTIFNHGYVNDAGSYGGGKYLCSPLLGDVRERGLTLPPPDWQSSDGYSVWYQRKSPLSAGREDIQVGRGGHYVVLNPNSYVDVIDPARRPIAAINTETGRVVAISYGADRGEMLNAWKHGGDVKSERWNYAVSRSTKRHLAVVVKSVRSSLVGDWPWLFGTWLAAGVTIGVGLGWLAYKRVSRQLSFPATLQWAISRKKIQVVFQPIIRLAQGHCVGVEALARWQLNGRSISPEIFVAVAEENQLIQPMTDVLLEKIIAELGGLLRADPSFYVSVNVSSEDLRSDRLLRLLTASLVGTGIRPAQIRIEATERSFLHADATRDVIEAFRAAGHPVYIDDFGTGYSSLSYLQTFRVDALKIDKSFVDTMAGDSASSVVAPHIIAMAHELGVELVAEGVESELQVNYLLEKGVQYGQGWYYAKPMTAVALGEWLATRQASPEREAMAAS